MRHMLACLGAMGLGLFASGCGAGAFRQATTNDQCKAGDDRCTRAFDAPIALGATATPEVAVSTNGSSSPGLHFESAAPSILEVDGGRVIGRSEGTSALLFVSDASTVLDFLHVWIKKPTALALEAALPGREAYGRVDGVLDVLVGEELRLAIHPVADGQRLIGSGEATWKVEPPLLALLREGSDDHRRVVAEMPGTSTLQVEMLGVTSTVQIVVHARNAAPTAAPPPPASRPSSRARGAS